jgi:hypothetical protein
VPARRPRRLTFALLLLTTGCFLVGGSETVEARRSWQRPVEGAVLSAFRFDPARPYVRGARRNVTLAAASGQAVRAACGGVVTFAGPLPGDLGAGVTLRCGALAATHLGLAGLRVRRGSAVPAGAVLGVAAGSRVRLGARRVGARHGYLDPLTLMGTAGGRRPLPPVPLGRAPQGRPTPALSPRPSLARPERVPSARAPALAEPRGSRAAVPGAAWLGLALLAIGVPGGRALTVAGRRRAGLAARRPGHRALPP